jgi:hypothetical protein
MVITFLEALMNSAYFNLVEFKEKRPLGKWMYQLTVFCMYIRNISSSKKELPRRLLKLIFQLFAVPEYFWVSEVFSNNVKLNPNK